MKFKLSEKIAWYEDGTVWKKEEDVKEFIRLSKKIRILDFVKVSKLGVLEFDKIGYHKEIDNLSGFSDDFKDIKVVAKKLQDEVSK